MRKCSRSTPVLKRHTARVPAPQPAPRPLPCSRARGACRFVPRFVPERRYGSKLHTYALAHQMGAFDAISREAARSTKLLFFGCPYVLEARGVLNTVAAGSQLSSPPQDGYARRSGREAAAPPSCATREAAPSSRAMTPTWQVVASCTRTISS